MTRLTQQEESMEQDRDKDAEQEKRPYWVIARERVKAAHLNAYAAFNSQTETKRWVIREGHQPWNPLCERQDSEESAWVAALAELRAKPTSAPHLPTEEPPEGRETEYNVWRASGSISPWCVDQLDSEGREVRAWRGLHTLQDVAKVFAGLPAAHPSPTEGGQPDAVPVLPENYLNPERWERSEDREYMKVVPNGEFVRWHRFEKVRDTLLAQLQAANERASLFEGLHSTRADLHERATAAAHKAEQELASLRSLCNAVWRGDSVNWQHFPSMAPQQIKPLLAQIEQLEVQLAGCHVAATGWAKGEQAVKFGDYGWSASYQMVAELREKYEALRSAGTQAPKRGNDAQA